MINPPFPIAIVLKDSTSSFKLTTKNFPNREGSTADTKAPPGWESCWWCRKEEKVEQDCDASQLNPGWQKWSVSVCLRNCVSVVSQTSECLSLDQPLPEQGRNSAVNLPLSITSEGAIPLFPCFFPLFFFCLATFNPEKKKKKKIVFFTRFMKKVGFGFIFFHLLVCLVWFYSFGWLFY